MDIGALDSVTEDMANKRYREDPGSDDDEELEGKAVRKCGHPVYGHLLTTKVVLYIPAIGKVVVPAGEIEGVRDRVYFSGDLVTWIDQKENMWYQVDALTGLLTAKYPDKVKRTIVIKTGHSTLSTLQGMDGYLLPMGTVVCGTKVTSRWGTVFESQNYNPVVVEQGNDIVNIFETVGNVIFHHVLHAEKYRTVCSDGTTADSSVMEVVDGTTESDGAKLSDKMDVSGQTIETLKFKKELPGTIMAIAVDKDVRRIYCKLMGYCDTEILINGVRIMEHNCSFMVNPNCIQHPDGAHVDIALPLKWISKTGENELSGPLLEGGIFTTMSIIGVLI